MSGVTCKTSSVNDSLHLPLLGLSSIGVLQPLVRAAVAWATLCPFGTLLKKESGTLQVSSMVGPPPFSNVKGRACCPLTMYCSFCLERRGGTLPFCSFIEFQNR